ncbi:MAG: MoaD/ThiS family protein [Acidobacteria bacterium]|nr:MoaD/ThiS family protein [Acidobacteriota bacterium]
MALYQLRLFAFFREQLNQEVIDLEGPDQAMAGELLDRFFERHPHLAKYRSISRLALNRQFVGPDAVCSSNDELALIPPVSGG